jgi:acyl carrier protein
MSNPRAEIRRFIVDNFLFGDAEFRLSDDDSLVDRGVVDSSGILELVAFLEERFRITLTDTELVPANLDTIERIARFVSSKLAMELHLES